MIEVNEYIQTGYSFICLFDSSHEIKGDGEWDDLASKGEKELLIIASPFEKNKIQLFIDEEINSKIVESYFKGECKIKVPSNELIIQGGWAIDEKTPTYAKIKVQEEILIKYFVSDLENPSIILIQVETNNSIGF